MRNNGQRPRLQPPVQRQTLRAGFQHLLQRLARVTVPLRCQCRIPAHFRQAQRLFPVAQLSTAMLRRMAQRQCQRLVSRIFPRHLLLLWLPRTPPVDSMYRSRILPCRVLPPRPPSRKALPLKELQRICHVRLRQLEPCQILPSRRDPPVLLGRAAESSSTHCNHTRQICQIRTDLYPPHSRIWDRACL